MSSWAYWVAARFSGHDTMFVEKGWKTFLRSRNISRGDTIVFRFDGEDTLWARIFDSDGDRACVVWRAPAMKNSLVKKNLKRKMKPTLKKMSEAEDFSS